MFTIATIKDQDFKKLMLADTAMGSYVEILPGCGGILHSFNIIHNNSLLNIIDNYLNELDFLENITAKGFKSCKLSPFVCRINQGEYTFAGNTYKLEKFYLGDHALHGLLYDVPFIVTEQYADEHKASVTLSHQYRGTDKGYPFHFDCSIRYDLSANNSLELTTTIVNKDAGLIPIQDGWHPYFKLGEKIDLLQLEFQSLARVEFNEELIPTGKLIPFQEFDSIIPIGDKIFDNCFSLNFAECQPLIVLRDPINKLQLEIRPSNAYPYLQIYTPPHRKSIALENLSSIPDAFNNGMGLITLEPGGTAEFTTNYKITSLI